MKKITNEHAMNERELLQAKTHIEELKHGINQREAETAENTTNNTEEISSLKT